MRSAATRKGITIDDAIEMAKQAYASPCFHRVWLRRARE